MIKLIGGQVIAARSANTEQAIMKDEKFQLEMHRFYNSGLLKNFIAESRKYCFICNIDNFSSTV